MAWLAPLIITVLIFIAYLGGKSAGKKEAELERIKKEQEISNSADEIIDNNCNMSADDFDAWLHSRSKK